uniref:Uncharacterized protein n=1 Tax=Cacopsylla melanoneura TaxID=428564 RepID=A0A8D8T457_9HEMI
MWQHCTLKGKQCCQTWLNFAIYGEILSRMGKTWRIFLNSEKMGIFISLHREKNDDYRDFLGSSEKVEISINSFITKIKEHYYLILFLVFSLFYSSILIILFRKPLLSWAKLKTKPIECVKS